MKTSFLTCLIFLTTLSLSAQIKNPDFELSRDTAKDLPQSWNFKKTDGFIASLDNHITKSGNMAYRVTNIGNNSPTAFAPFSQVVDINITHLQKITISAWIKTDNMKGTAGLWSQVWDKNKKMIGFQSLQNLGIKVDSTRDWAQYSITLVLDTNAKHLLLGGFLMGTGTVWYDDFSMGSLAGADDAPSKEVKKYIEEVTYIIKTNSIYMDSLNWKSIDADVAELSKGLKTSTDAQLVTAYIMGKLRAAGDHHSFIQSKISTQNYAKGNTDPAQPLAKLLPGNIGYVAVPGFGSVNDTACLHFAERIQNLIRQLDEANAVTGWVVDLRENHGGNMWPMIAGLGPIIGNGTLGYFVTAKTENAWRYHNGNDGSVNVKDAYKLKDPGTKIAVLIGPGTASSGEMTTISFIGKHNVELIGEPSGGFTTANRSFLLSSGETLNLASSYCADRNKHKYMGKIQPDVVLPNDTKGYDRQLASATMWISGK